MVEEYTLIPHGESGMCCMIKSGKYAGIAFQYGTVKFLEDDNDNCTLNFQYDIITHPEELVLEEIQSKDFGEVAGDILVDILIKDLDDKKHEIPYEDIDDVSDEVKEALERLRDEQKQMREAENG